MAGITDRTPCRCFCLASADRALFPLSFTADFLPHPQIKTRREPDAGRPARMIRPVFALRHHPRRVMPRVLADIDFAPYAPAAAVASSVAMASSTLMAPVTTIGNRR